MNRRRILLLVVFGSTASLSGCGGTDYESVPDLVKSLRSAGIDCPLLTEAQPPNGGAVDHGSCWTSNNQSLFEVDVYGSANDRDRTITSWSGVAPYCVAYGEHWTVRLLGDANDPTCDAIADRLDGQVKRGRADSDTPE